MTGGFSAAWRAWQGLVNNLQFKVFRIQIRARRAKKSNGWYAKDYGKVSHAGINANDSIGKRDDRRALPQASLSSQVFQAISCLLIQSIGFCHVPQATQEHNIQA